MNSTRKTAIVAGASQGIGAGIVKAFVERRFNVVASFRKVTQSTEVAACDRAGSHHRIERNMSMLVLLSLTGRHVCYRNLVFARYSP
jgi:NAD(P)-dependent dehydrogenase (short-subunit alcohol dehydrogenase family)